MPLDTPFRSGSFARPKDKSFATRGHLSIATNHTFDSSAYTDLSPRSPTSIYSVSHHPETSTLIPESRNPPIAPRLPPSKIPKTHDAARRQSASEASISFDNGTGFLSPEVVRHIQQTGKVPTNVRKTPSMARILSGPSAERKRPQTLSHRQSNHSKYSSPIQPEDDDWWNDERPFQRPVTQTSLAIPAATHPALNRTISTPPRPRLQSQPPPPTRTYTNLTSPRRTLRPPSHPHSNRDFNSIYSLYHHPHQQHHPRPPTTSSTGPSHATISRPLPTRTRTPTTQGRHLRSDKARRFRPAKTWDCSCATCETLRAEAGYGAASVAAGRSIYTAMTRNGNLDQTRSLMVGTRRSEREGWWLRGGTMRRHHQQQYQYGIEEKIRMERRRRENVTTEKVEVQGGDKRKEEGPTMSRWRGLFKGKKMRMSREQDNTASKQDAKVGAYVEETSGWYDSD